MMVLMVQHEIVQESPAEDFLAGPQHDRTRRSFGQILGHLQ